MTKLYLDIDGVLLTKRNTKAVPYGAEFIDFVTERFDCYWLTTHCKSNAETATRYLARFYGPESIAKLRRVKATDWQTLKTEGIDFSSGFYWLDDAPFESESAHLERNGALEQLIIVDLGRENELQAIKAQLSGKMMVEALIIKVQSQKRELEITFYPGATEEALDNLEQTLELRLPDDVRAFYRFCNGFESAAEDFRIIPLEEILERRNHFSRNHFYVAEYLCYCDVWEITIDADDNNQYLIQNWDEKSELVTLTNSFVAFLNRFLDGRVYEKDGLYEWKEEMKNEQ